MAETLAQGTTQEVGGLIDSRPLMPIQFRIIVICGLVMMLDGYDIQVMGSAVPSVAGSPQFQMSTWLVAVAEPMSVAIAAAPAAARQSTPATSLQLFQSGAADAKALPVASVSAVAAATWTQFALV